MLRRSLPCVLTLLLISHLAMADVDVDDADSLDFEAFHQSAKKPAESVPGKQLKVIRTRDKHNKFATATSYQISELYSLGPSNHTPYSAFSVIEALHIKMAKHCPKGWEKLHEWVERQPNSNVLRMTYHFRCLP